MAPDKDGDGFDGQLVDRVVVTIAPMFLQGYNVLATEANAGGAACAASGSGANRGCCCCGGGGGGGGGSRSGTLGRCYIKLATR